ncbi:MAG: sigma-54-dependent Fis family transcriptional regulator [Candidatus Schekmanbacteria bacterium]|nr:sigma-54-dependent Fis family transcriptional regulator [Candidatus Schekmanbacteria bacterium]
MSSILVVDDDRGIRRGIGLALRGKGYEVTEAPDGAKAEELLLKRPFDLVITDLEMPGLNGIELLKKIREVAPDTLALVVSGYGTIEKAVEAMRVGAQDFITKGDSFSIDELEVKVARLLEQRALTEENRRLAAENKTLRREIEHRFSFDTIIGTSPALEAVFRRMEKVVEDGQVTVLIRGDSGTGKELVARAIHYNGPRKDRPFIAINCAAIPDTLLESELFGYEKGSFTDAYRRKIGKFEAAGSGTVFLDEIGDLSPKLQVKLLRVLQERRFERIGSTTSVAVEARVITATNRDLEAAIRDGSFRQDLYYRLNVVPIYLPALRERRTDIPMLVDHFLKKFNNDKGKNLRFAPEALDQLVRYDWPGNVRELENLLEQLIILTSTGVIEVHHLPPHIKGESRDFVINLPDGNLDMKAARQVLLESFEKRFIAEALDRNSGNVTQTAKEIGESREGLHRKIKRYGISNDR